MISLWSNIFDQVFYVALLIGVVLLHQRFVKKYRQNVDKIGQSYREGLQQISQYYLDTLNKEVQHYEGLHNTEDTRL